jgi:hypothetical protein
MSHLHGVLLLLGRDLRVLPTSAACIGTSVGYVLISPRPWVVLLKLLPYNSIG